MAKKDEMVNIVFEPLKQTLIKVRLNGTGDLILHKKNRLFTMSEIWKQDHPKGSKMPCNLDQMLNKNKWEQLITSVTWEKPIEFHDDDPMLYSEEEWNEYMKNNRPCILAAAFAGSMQECFTTFFRDQTGKKGTDFRRAINVTQSKFPVDFASVRAEDILVPNTGMNKTNVVSHQNVFSGWSCDLELMSVDSVFPSDVIVEVLATAGKFIGVGTQRKNGFGHWELSNIELMPIVQ